MGIRNGSDWQSKIPSTIFRSKGFSKAKGENGIPAREMRSFYGCQPDGKKPAGCDTHTLSDGVYYI